MLKNTISLFNDFAGLYQTDILASKFDRKIVTLQCSKQKFNFSYSHTNKLVDRAYTGSIGNRLLISLFYKKRIIKQMLKTQLYKFVFK